MQKIELIKSKVEFYEDAHEYWLKNKQLQGITGILHRHLFERKYSGIPKKILDNAAKEGSRIHLLIELCDTFGTSSPDFFFQRYNALKEQYNLTTLANEYLVSDNTDYATKIDIVFEDISLGDIKTTSKLDREYLSWQLSIGAGFFELNNPHLKVNKLYGVWLPQPRYGKPKIVEVERKPQEETKRLLWCDKNKIKFIPNPLL